MNGRRRAKLGRELGDVEVVACRPQAADLRQSKGAARVDQAGIHVQSRYVDDAGPGWDRHLIADRVNHAVADHDRPVFDRSAADGVHCSANDSEQAASLLNLSNV